MVAIEQIKAPAINPDPGGRNFDAPDFAGPILAARKLQLDAANSALDNIYRYADLEFRKRNSDQQYQLGREQNQIAGMNNLMDYQLGREQNSINWFANALKGNENQLQYALGLEKLALAKKNINDYATVRNFNDFGVLPSGGTGGGAPATSGTGWRSGFAVPSGASAQSAPSNMNLYGTPGMGSLLGPSSKYGQTSF